MKVLICHTQDGFAGELSDALRMSGVVSSKVTQGKECQLKIFQDKPDVLIIDVQTKSHSAVEVIKYVKSNHLKTKVYLCFNDGMQAQEYKATPELLGRMGVHEMVLVTQGAMSIVELLFSDEIFRETVSEYEGYSEIEAETYEMGILDAIDLMKGSKALMDYFQFDKGTRYKRVISKGQTLKEIPSQTLFYRKRDRYLYIQFMNSLLDTIGTDTVVQTSSRFVAVKSVSDQYITEFYIKGLSPKMVEEGKRICKNMFAFVENDPGLQKMMRTWEQESPSRISKLFLVAFFSSFIAKSLSWSTRRTAEMVALGGLLHDIGLPAGDLDIKETKMEYLEPSQLARYLAHPGAGANILKDVIDMPQPVIQIVYQHHEYVNGEGFPNKLTGAQMYPLAKVVACAAGFVSHMLDNNLNPLQTINEFVKDRQNIERYDSEMIKALIKSFIKEKV